MQLGLHARRRQLVVRIKDAQLVLHCDGEQTATKAAPRLYAGLGEKHTRFWNTRCAMPFEYRSVR